MENELRIVCRDKEVCAKPIGSYVQPLVLFQAR